MSYGTSGTLRRLRHGVVGAAVGLGIAACGSAGVSNGTTTASSSGSGEGVASGNGTATLTWIPVTQNTDGTLLIDLAGYKVFYGPSAAAMNIVTELPDPSLTSYVVANLPSGTWYVTVAAYTTSGTQGAISNVGTKTIN